MEDDTSRRFSDDYLDNLPFIDPQKKSIENGLPEDDDLDNLPFSYLQEESIENGLPEDEEAEGNSNLLHGFEKSEMEAFVMDKVANKNDEMRWVIKQEEPLALNPLNQASEKLKKLGRNYSKLSMFAGGAVGAVGAVLRRRQGRPPPSPHSLTLKELEEYFKSNKKKAIMCLLWLIDYYALRFYLENKIIECNQQKDKLSKWIMHYATLKYLFPMKPLKFDSVNLWEPGYDRKDIMKTIYDFTKNGIELLKKKIETTQEQGIMKEWIEISEIINKFPIKGLNKINSANIHKEWEGLEFFNWDTYKNRYTPEQTKVKFEKEYNNYEWNKIGPHEEDDANEKKLYEVESPLLSTLTRTKYFKELDIKRLGGGANINNLIEPSSIMELDKDNKTLREFIDNLNNKFRELNEEFCINCDREQQLKKLNKVFNVNNMNENELYQKYNITVRDLLLCVYLNMIEYIENSLIKDKYKLTFIDTIETVINEHILYSIWFFIFSKYYVFEEFKSKINKGKCRIEEIIRYIRDKEKIKFSKINEEIYEKFYKNILTKFVYNIKINRDYYNLTNSSINEKNKYDKKYIKNKIRIEEIYKNLVNIINIKENIKIYSTYNKNIVNLLNSVIKIIIFYRNLYIYSNNICKFYSINNMRTKKEVKYNINNFSSYLNIQKFIKTHSIKNKKLMIDNEIIVCKSIKDFNKYINKLSKKINKLNLDFITEKWDLVELKLKNMDIFTDFEIECIKLIIAFNYNNNLLKKTNKFIKNYNLYKKMFKKYLEKFDVEYKNITEYNYNIDNISSIFTGIEFKNLLKNKSCLGYI